MPIPVLRLVALLLALNVLPAAHAPALRGPGVIEFHGVLRGERFWARLLPYDATFGGRLLQVVYTAPKPEQLAGTHLDDHPYVLLDDAARVLAWNERSNLSTLRREGEGYRVTLERNRSTGADAVMDEVPRRLKGPAAWDLRLAPLLVALSWRPGQDIRVPAADFFGPEPLKAGPVSWQGAAALITGEEPLRIESDGQGRLTALRRDDGSELLRISGWLADGATAATAPAERLP